MKDTHIKLGIIDDDALVARLLEGFFLEVDTIEVAYTADSGNKFLKYIEDDRNIMPDVILLDLRMKDGSGIEVLEELTRRESNIKVILLSTYYKASYIGQMLKLNCNAFVPKEIDPENLVEVIKTVHKQGIFFNEEQMQYMRENITTTGPRVASDGREMISEREKEVLGLVCSQLTAREIAERLFISPKTVEMHKSNLLLKTGARNTVGLIFYAIENGLIDADEFLGY